MRVRLLNNAELSQAKCLANYAFNEKSFADWFFDKYVQPEQLVGNFAAEDKLKCMLCLAPYKINLNGKQLDSAYITTVTTAPDARGKGYFQPLLKNTFEHLRTLGKPVAILKAIESKLYSPFGFAFCYAHLRYNMPLRELEYFPKSSKLTMLSISDFEEYLPSLDDLYNSLVVSTYNATSVRTLQNWRNLLTIHQMEGGHIMLALHNGEPVGYMLYYVRNDTFEVFELLAADNAVQAHFLNVAYQHRTQAKNFFWRTFIDNTAYLDMNISQYGDSVYPQLAPFMMVRVVDVRNLLAALNTSQTTSICLQITDDFLEFNNCTLAITVKDSQLVIQEATNASACMDVATLAQLFFGAYSVQELLAAKKIQILDTACIAALNSLFVQQTNYINEEF